jgi:hypothetical protein
VSFACFGPEADEAADVAAWARFEEGFRAGGLVAAGVLADDVVVAVFFAGGFFAGGFVAGAFVAGGFLVEDFVAGARVAGVVVFVDVVARASVAAGLVGAVVPDSPVAGGCVGAPEPVGCRAGVEAVVAAGVVTVLARVLAEAAALSEPDLSAPEVAGAPGRDAAAARRVDAGSGSNVRVLGPEVGGVGESAGGAEDRDRARAEPGIGRRGSSRSWITGATILMTSSSLADASGSRRTPYRMVATPMR